MAQALQFEKSYQNVLTPAEPGTNEYLQLILVRQLPCDESRKPRNYAFHKKFLKLLTLRYHYWTPSDGLIEPTECILTSGLIDFLSSDSGWRTALQNATEMYFSPIGISRSHDMMLLKHFGPFREWATIQVGFYDGYQMFDGSRRRVAKSISFTNVDDSQLNGIYKSVLSVLWNCILRRKFCSLTEAEDTTSQLLNLTG